MITEIVISALLVLGGLFGLIGSYGLLKLNNPVKRLHAPTKATTLGVGAVLVASVLYFKIVRGIVTWQELLIVVFLFITSPVTALFLSKVHLHRNMSATELPPTGTKRGWATFDGDPADRDARHL